MDFTRCTPCSWSNYTIVSNLAVHGRPSLCISNTSTICHVIYRVSLRPWLSLCHLAICGLMGFAPLSCIRLLGEFSIHMTLLFVQHVSLPFKVTECQERAYWFDFIFLPQYKFISSFWMWFTLVLRLANVDFYVSLNLLTSLYQYNPHREAGIIVV